MEIKEGRLITRVKLEGKKFSTFEDALIDTGSAFTVIPPQIADFLELEIHKGSPKVHLVTASGLIEPSLKILDKLEIENITVERLPVVIHEIPDPAPIKVLLGMNFLDKARLTLNGKEKSFQIEDP
jgi:predicted aspartyl protease